MVQDIEAVSAPDYRKLIAIGHLCRGNSNIRYAPAISGRYNLTRRHCIILQKEVVVWDAVILKRKKKVFVSYFNDMY